MARNRLARMLTAGIVLLGCLAACSPSLPAGSAGVARPPGWSEATHGDAEPDYRAVFPDDRVNQITITIAPDKWAAMHAEMTELLGAAGSAENRDRGGWGGGRGMNVPNPSWVPATVSFNGLSWPNVGVRFKGNSSLMGSWRSGSSKLPLKLDFDEFEDQFPAINNQRFYGFKQLSLSNNWNDPTAMRETVTYDLLDKAGLIAADTASYEVLIDHGNGPQNLGLYTAIEVIDDTVIDRYFEDASGNIYEADGPGASLAEGTADQIESSFQKENNESAGDWSDIKQLYEVLHAGERGSDPAAWRSRLEAVFDVDNFLSWLALSAVIQHWDTYGAMTHNFYLYDNPDTGKLSWISWDHNLVLGAIGGPGGRMGQGPPQNGGNPVFGGFGARMRTTLDKNDVGSDWPLIRFLLDDPTYKAAYMSKLETIGAEVFDSAALTAEYRRLAALLEPYAAAESSAEAFDDAVEALTTQTRERAKALDEFLAQN